jgi:hypothetical protein
MSRMNKVVDFLFEKSAYCPICGKTLEIEIRDVGAPPYRVFQMEVKICPDGHGELSIDDTRGGPDIVFEAPPSFYESVEG